LDEEKLAEKKRKKNQKKKRKRKEKKVMLSQNHNPYEVIQQENSNKTTIQINTQ
jgi:hypothetical protein